MGAAGVEGAGKALEGVGIGIAAGYTMWLALHELVSLVFQPSHPPYKPTSPWRSHPSRVPNLCDKDASSSVSTNMHSGYNLIATLPSPLAAHPLFKSAISALSCLACFEGSSSSISERLHSRHYLVATLLPLPLPSRSVTSASSRPGCSEAAASTPRWARSRSASTRATSPST